jgi:hypothetical protein
MKEKVSVQLQIEQLECWTSIHWTGRLDRQSGKHTTSSCERTNNEPKEHGSSYDHDRPQPH